MTTIGQIWSAAGSEARRAPRRFFGGAAEVAAGTANSRNSQSGAASRWSLSPHSKPSRAIWSAAGSEARRAPRCQAPCLRTLKIANHGRRRFDSGRSMKRGCAPLHPVETVLPRHLQNLTRRGRRVNFEAGPYFLLWTVRLRSMHFWSFARVSCRLYFRRAGVCSFPVPARARCRRQ